MSNVVIAVLIFVIVWLFVDRMRKHNRYDGSMIVSVPAEGRKLFSLELDVTPEDLETRNSITFKVVKEDVITKDLP